MSYECKYCYNTFRTPRSRLQHEEAVHIYTWRCPDCSDAYSNEEALDQHINEDHTVWYDCKICPTYGQSKRFRSEQSLDQHVQNAAGHQNFCYGCKRSYINPNALAQHLKSSVHVGRNVKCPWCPLMFVNLTGVCHHLESDTCTSGITRAKIDAFVRQVDRNNVITKKLLTWDGYEQSGERLATSDSWNSSRGGYQCYLCSRTFVALSALNQHLKSPVHEQKRYHCPKCRSEFVRLAGLVNHIESERCGVLRFDVQGGGIGGMSGMVNRMITY